MFSFPIMLLITYFVGGWGWLFLPIAWIGWLAGTWYFDRTQTVTAARMRDGWLPEEYES